MVLSVLFKNRIRADRVASGYYRLERKCAEWSARVTIGSVKDRPDPVPAGTILETEQ